MKYQTVFSKPLEFASPPFLLREGRGWEQGQAREKEGEEKARALFLVELIEKYNYQEDKVRLKTEIPENGEADIVVYKNKKPYIVAECRRGKGIGKKEVKKAQKMLFRKARLLKARYAVLVVGRDRVIFDVRPGPLPLTELPKGEE